MTSLSPPPETGCGPVELVIPAPRNERWWEPLIAGMVGRRLKIGEREGTITFAAPRDGSPEEGASAVELRVEHDWQRVGLDSWACKHCWERKTAIV